MVDTLPAFHVYHGTVKDTFLSSKFIDSVPVRDLRCNRLLEERFYSSDYLMNQTVSRLRYKDEK